MSNTLLGLARVHLASGDTVIAQPFLREAVSIRRRALGPDQERTRAAQAELARAAGGEGSRR